MRILMLTGQLPFPPHAGGALRTFGLIDGLHRAGHHVDLLSFADSSTMGFAPAPLVERCQLIKMLPAPKRSRRTRLRELLLSTRADMQTRYYSPAYEGALTTLLSAERYDLIQIESLEMAVYLPVIRRCAGGSRAIYDSFNAEYDLQRVIFNTDLSSLRGLPGALYSFIQWRRLRAFERSVCQQVDQVIAVSEADAQAFRALLPTVRVAVVPNGIFVGDYRRDSTTTALDLGDHALLFTGSMSYRPNIDAMLWMAESIFPAISREVPDARLYIVGSQPSARLGSLRRNPDIHITGYVQEVQPFLQYAAVYVAPLRMGSGTRLKLLQAMAAELPIVATRIGAQGLDIASGREMVLADDPVEFAQAVVGLLRDPARRAALGQAARALVAERYDWSVIMPKMLKVIGSLG
jgi:glycosyltransferase involved in cell wall biosynthesis